MEGVADTDPFVAGRAAYDQGDFPTAYRLWSTLAEGGVPAAQCNLGSLYQFGWGVTQDFAEALRWYRKAANQGFAPAQHNLGVLFHNGQGVAQDFVRAYMWWSLAASLGIDESSKVRNALAGLMTPAQIAKGEALAAKRQPKPH
jgi:hypothetical protein